MSNRLPALLVAAAAACSGEGDAVLEDARETDAPSLDAALALDAAPPLPGEVCQRPEAIAIPGGLGDATVNGTTVAYRNHYVPPPECTGYFEDGPDHVYTISIPAGARLDASVTPTDATYDPAIYLVGTPAEMCDADPIVCLAGDDSGVQNVVNRVRYDNTTSATVDVFIIISGVDDTSGGTFTLAATVAAGHSVSP